MSVGFRDETGREDWLGDRSVRRRQRVDWELRIPDSQRTAWHAVVESGELGDQILRVYEFAVWASAPGAQFYGLSYEHERMMWLPYRQAISIRDVVRRFGDYTTWAKYPGLLWRQGMLNKLPEKRRDLCNNHLLDYYVPTERLLPRKWNPKYKQTLLTLLSEARTAYENDEMTYREFWRYMGELLYTPHMLMVLPEDEDSSE